MTLHRNAAALVIAIGCLHPQLTAQQTAAPATSNAAQLETVPEMRNSLPADQQAAFDRAIGLFNQGKFAEARPQFQAILTHKPGDAVLQKFIAECALNQKDNAGAKALLDGVLAANANDWQALTMLARLAAESGDKPTRDADIARIAKLHDSGTIPTQVTQYPIERIPLADGRSMLLFQSVYPWGNFKVHNYARIFDASNSLVSRITLESGDFDQPLFRKEHPTEAAAGKRLFSYDGYSNGPAQPNGQRTETHATYGFAIGEPTYDEMRARFLAIANGKNTPSSSNTHPAAP